MITGCRRLWIGGLSRSGGRRRGWDCSRPFVITDFLLAFGFAEMEKKMFCYAAALEERNLSLDQSNLFYRINASIDDDTSNVSIRNKNVKIFDFKALFDILENEFFQRTSFEGLEKITLFWKALSKPENVLIDLLSFSKKSGQVEMCQEQENLHHQNLFTIFSKEIWVHFIFMKLPISKFSAQEMMFISKMQRITKVILGCYKLIFFSVKPKWGNSFPCREFKQYHLSITPKMHDKFCNWKDKHKTLLKRIRLQNRKQ